MKVFILATCRKPELLPWTVLVFDTLRVGFPTAHVKVYLNNLTGTALESVEALCFGNDCEHERVTTIHHDWIAKLLTENQEPFWILDTDVIFFAKVEDFQFDAPLAGHRIPEFMDEFSGCITRSRLHTSLLRFDPEKIGYRLRAIRRIIPDTPFTPFPTLVDPIIVPLRSRLYFYDTCSSLYHAVGGQKFEAEQKNCYWHAHFGTISDLVLPRLKNGEAMEKRREEILTKPHLGYGLWREGEQWLRDRQPQL